MLLTYLDESYTKDRFYIAALGVHHDSVRSLERAITAVVTRAQDSYPGVTHASELHGHAIFHGTEDWSPLQPRQSIGIFNQVFQAISAHEVAIILRGLDISAQRSRYERPDPPHQVVLQHVLEQVDKYARSTNQEALIIADEVSEHDRHRANLRAFRRHGTPGYVRSRLPRIVDTIHFAPSHHSRLLQAADLVAFMHRRRETHRETDSRAERASDALWARLRGRVHHQRCWTP